MEDWHYWDDIGRQAHAAEKHIRENDFWMPHEDLVRSIKRRKIHPGRLNVSSFSDWIIRHYTAAPDQGRLAYGVAGESLYKQRFVEHHFGELRVGPIGPKKAIVHCGIGPLALTNGFQIPSLSVFQRPIIGCPDLVYRSILSEEEQYHFLDTPVVEIVEIKMSSLGPPPRDLWPNVRAQLWAYSKIPVWAGVDRLILRCEVYNYRVYPTGFSMRVQGEVELDGDDPKLNLQCSELFDLWKWAHERLGE